MASAAADADHLSRSRLRARDRWSDDTSSAAIGAAVGARVEPARILSVGFDRDGLAQERMSNVRARSDELEIEVTQQVGAVTELAHLL